MTHLHLWCLPCAMRHHAAALAEAMLLRKEMHPPAPSRGRKELMSRKSTITAVLACSSLLALAGCEDGDSLPPSATLMDAQVPTDAGIGDAGPALQAVTLRFKAKLGSADFVCGRNYAGQGSTQREVTPQDFRFFVQEAYLLDATGEEVRIELDDGPFQTKDVALIDFAGEAGACGNVGGATTNLVITGKVPRGTYNGVVFVNGVPESLNHGDQTQAPQPLREAGPSAHWGWLQGYRFVMAEVASPLKSMDAGLVPPSDTDAGAAGRASAIHLGSTACTGMIGGFTCAKANRNRVRLPSFDPATQSIVADLSAVFAGVDLGSESTCHGTGPTCAAGFAALGVDGEGKPAATQQVFRVE